MENLQNPCYHYSINRLGAPLTPAVDILRGKFVIASECSERGDLRPLDQGAASGQGTFTTSVDCRDLSEVSQ